MLLVSKITDYFDVIHINLNCAFSSSISTWTQTYHYDESCIILTKCRGLYGFAFISIIIKIISPSVICVVTVTHHQNKTVLNITKAFYPVSVTRRH